MTNKIDPCDTMRNNLIAATVGLQQCTKTASNIIPIPGGERVIAIGTPAEVCALLAAEMDERCPHCDGTGDVHRPDGTWAGTCTCPAGAAHPDDLAVDRFAAAMKAKMAQKRAEGRGGWDDKAVCSAARLQIMLVEHLAKGDPVYVGNFAMMLWNRGEAVAAPTQVFPNDGREPDWAGYAAAEAAHAQQGEAPVAEWVSQEQGFQYLVEPYLPDGTKLYTQAVAPSDAKGKADAAIAGDPNEIHFNAMRLRNVARLVGMENAVPEDDETLDGARGSVLGLIAGKLRMMLATSAADAKDAAVQWISVSAKRPDIGQKVIAYGSNFGPQVLTYGDQPWPKFWCGERGKWWWNDDAMWMPLPDRTAQQAQSSPKGGE